MGEFYLLSEPVWIVWVGWLVGHGIPFYTNRLRSERTKVPLDVGTAKNLSDRTLSVITRLKERRRQ
jgi:hypothetical protein